MAGVPDRNLRPRPARTISVKSQSSKKSTSITSVVALKPTPPAKDSTASISCRKLVSIPSRSSISNRPSNASRPSISTQSSISKQQANSRQSPSILGRKSLKSDLTPHPHSQNKALSEKFFVIESRIGHIESKWDLEVRFANIESSFDELHSENRELKLTIERLKSDIESLQFVTAQLCALDYKLTDSEETCKQLHIENAKLNQTASRLTVEISEIKSDLNQLRTQQNTQTSSAKDIDFEHRHEQAPSEDGITFEQQQLNSNFIIRGVDTGESTSEAELKGVFNNILEHIGVHDNPEFAPVSIQLLRNHNSAKSAGIIQVRLSSATAKRHFLQARRLKKGIVPSDIGCNSDSHKPILIAEELTRNNQELLYQARSLRGSKKFRFVWSNDGQILARLKPKSKVIRIKSLEHINELRAFLNLVPLNNNHGRHNTSRIEPNDSHKSQI